MEKEEGGGLGRAVSGSGRVEEEGRDWVVGTIEMREWRGGKRGNEGTGKGIGRGRGIGGARE